MSSQPPAVRLRPLRLADVDELASWGADPAFVLAAEWGERTLQQRRDFWVRTIESPPRDLLRMAATIDDEDHEEVVGLVDLHGSEPTRRELGFMIRPTSWGRGVGTAAARAGIEHGFCELGLERVWAEAWASNQRSLAILRRVGMRPIGRGDDGEYLGARTHDEQFEIERSSADRR